VTAATGTTIEGVSVLSKKGDRSDRFAIALSPRGIEVRRRDHPTRLMSWDRVSQWEIEERDGYVVLILRGGGAATPLVVPGWTLDDLELLMRDVTSAPGTDLTGTAGLTAPPRPEPVEQAGVESHAGRRNGHRPVPIAWKPVVTVLLLGALATAITLVLLQSAGIIDWSFLGPVA
jgi:hypothetical protein